MSKVNLKEIEPSGIYEDLYGDKNDIECRSEWEEDLTGKPTIIGGTDVYADFIYLKDGEVYTYEFELDNDYGAKCVFRSEYTFSSGDISARYYIGMEGDEIEENWPYLFRDVGGLVWKSYVGDSKNKIESVYPYYYRKGNFHKNPQKIGNFIHCEDVRGEKWVITPLTIQRESGGLSVLEQMQTWEDGRLYYYWTKKIDEYNKLKDEGKI